jgi:hypothetical protein
MRTLRLKLAPLEQQEDSGPERRTVNSATLTVTESTVWFIGNITPVAATCAEASGTKNQVETRKEITFSFLSELQVTVSSLATVLEFSRVQVDFVGLNAHAKCAVWKQSNNIGFG